MLDKTEYVGPLSFACSHSLAMSVLPELLVKFKNLAPKVTTKVIFGHTGMIKNWIKEGVIEFGLVLDNDDLTPFSLEPLSKGAFRFYQSLNRPKNLPIVSCFFPPARAEVHLVKEMFFKKFGFELATEMEISSWEVIAKMMALTPSIGFLPDYMAYGKEKMGSIELSHLDLKIPYQIFGAFPRDEILGRNAQLFLNLTKELFVERQNTLNSPQNLSENESLIPVKKNLLEAVSKA